MAEVSTQERKRKRLRSGHGTSRKLDAVEVQISIKAHRVRGRRLTKELMESAVRRYALTGKPPKGMEIRITRWKNPDSVTESGWRNRGPQSERLATLRGILLRGHFTITRHRQAVGKARRKRRRKSPVPRLRSRKKRNLSRSAVHRPKNGRRKS